MEQNLAPEILMLREKWKDFRNQDYEKLKSLIESRVKNWFWASSDLYNIYPFHYESNGFKKGRVLKTEPSRKYLTHHYGVDENGEIIVDRSYPTHGDKYEVIFYDRKDGQVDYYHINDDQSISALSLFLYDGKRLIKAFFVGKCDYWETATYNYDSNGNVIYENMHLKAQHYDVIREHTFNYDEDGKIKTIYEGRGILLFKSKEAVNADSGKDFVAKEAEFGLVFPEKFKEKIKYGKLNIAGYQVLPVDRFYIENDYSRNYPETFNSVVIAENGIGDSVNLLLKKGSKNELGEFLYEFLHETGTVRRQSNKRLMP